MNDQQRREVFEHADMCDMWESQASEPARQLVVVQCQGAVCQVRAPRRVADRQRYRMAKRGKVRGLSARARLRYLSMVARLKLQPSEWRFVTLTFSREREWQAAKLLLDRWLHDVLEQQYPNSSAIWGQEYGGEGQRLHFHLLIRAPINREWVQRTWHRITGDFGGPRWVVARHGREVFGPKGWVCDSDQGASLWQSEDAAIIVAQRVGGDVRRARVLVGCTVLRSQNGGLYYVAKYMAKPSKYSGIGRESGRVWGVRGRKYLPWAPIESYSMRYGSDAFEQVMSAGCRSPDWPGTWFFCGHVRAPDTPGWWALDATVNAIVRLGAEQREDLPWIS